MNREDLLEMILNNAQPIIDGGETHLPMLIGVNQAIELSIYAFAELDHKQAVANLCQRIVTEEEMYMAAWVSEAWTALIDQDDTERMRHQQDHGLEHMPGRKEVLLISIQDAQADTVWTVPIEGEGDSRKLMVSSKKKMEGGESHNRWQLFPKPQAAN